MNGTHATSAPSSETLKRLVQSHRDFLAFVEPRVGDRATAEDILQAAFVRAMEKGGTLAEEQSAVAWFYRVLRNALADHYRRGGRRDRALARHGSEAMTSDEEIHEVVCRCVDLLLPTLKDEYAEMIQQVDLGERPIEEVAASLGITKNNATVRLHRARRSLRAALEASCKTCATHGCFDCSCAGAPA